MIVGATKHSSPKLLNREGKMKAVWVPTILAILGLLLYVFARFRSLKQNDPCCLIKPIYKCWCGLGVCGPHFKKYDIDERALRCFVVPRQKIKCPHSLFAQVTRWIKSIWWIESIRICFYWGLWKLTGKLYLRQYSLLQYLSVRAPLFTNVLHLIQRKDFGCTKEFARCWPCIA